MPEAQGESYARVNTAKIIWREERLESLQVSADELQPIRFQGQSFDTETGLHYNRFRYFDPDLGMFTTRDPIGLLGGMNVFQYAPNPVGWIDPFGLSCTNLWNQFQSNSRGLFDSRAQAAKAYQFWKAQNWKALEKVMGPGAWPPNRGFVSIKTTTLQPGAKIDRYGGWHQDGSFHDKGTFVSPAGNSFGSRALPAETAQKPYNIYEVISPIDVKSGPAIPWFGQEGLGTQYELPNNIDDLIQSGHIRRL